MTPPDVRQLRGEDLDRLTWTRQPDRACHLGEAQQLIARVDEFDYVVACSGDRIVGIGAAGYRTPYGGASLVSLSVDPLVRAPDPTAVLLAHLERRAWELTCTSVDVRVAATDRVARARVETLGYDLVGAATTTVPAGVAPANGTGIGTVRHVDSWVLRKDL